MAASKPGEGPPVETFDSPFLATKIALPKVAPRWIDRPRLIDRLGVPPSARVTLLHAGPGFGKTACLAQWQKRLALSGIRVAWYTVEQDDDDIAVFLGYAAAALNAADGAIGADVMELSRGGPKARSGILVTQLLNQIAASRDRYVIVVDDYHAVSSPEIDDAMSHLLLHAPDNLDVVIAARGLPNLRLGKLRADGKVMELGPESLGLTRAETGDFVQRALGVELPARDVTQLQTISEGWPAVLQMMLVALGSKKHLHQLIRGFTGEARVLREYLAQEAFEGLPPGLQQFLLRTSVLGRFCAELAECVTGDANAAGTIAEIEHRQLLVVTLDAHGRWFRYHPLFADFLQGQLRGREPGTEAALNRRASEWFERNRLWAEAVRHAFAAGDEAHALDIIDRCAMTLIELGEYVTLLGWLARFPADAVRTRPRLMTVRAWALGLTMRHQEASAVVAELRRLHEVALRNDPDLVAELALLEGGMAVLDDDFSDDAFLDTWATHHARTSPWLRDAYKTLGSYTLTMRREYRQARGFAPCETPLKIALLKMLVGTAWWREGDGAEAERAWTDGLEFADAEFGAHSVTAALVRACAARIAYERGEWRDAQEAIDERLGVLEEAAPLEWLWMAYTTLAWALVAGNRRDDAKAMLERGGALARQRRWHRLEAALGVELMRVAEPRTLGALAGLAARLEEIGRAANPSTTTGAETVFLAELGVGYHAGRTRIGSEGANRIARAIDGYGVNGSAPLRAQALLMLAQAREDAGRHDEALTSLSQSLAIGERLRLGQTYRDAGADVADLLRAILERPAGRGTAPSAAYLELLMSPTDIAVAPSSRPQGDDRAIASLSEREREILMLVGRGMSNKEIGRSLRIGPETVKWHLKNLFMKLEVPNRIQAVNRARGMALIG